MSDSPATRIRTLLADDHALLLESIARLLGPEFEIVGAVGDGQALLEVATKLHPELVILDIAMPRLNGLDAGRRVKELLPEVKLVYLTVNEDPDTVTEALRAGASAYVFKSAAAKELLLAIRVALKGGMYVTPSATDVIYPSPGPARPGEKSSIPRESTKSAQTPAREEGSK